MTSLHSVAMVLLVLHPVSGLFVMHWIVDCICITQIHVFFLSAVRYLESHHWGVYMALTSAHVQ
jgi:hypothetical protein